VNTHDDIQAIVESYPDLEDGTLCLKGTRGLVFHLINALTIRMEQEDIPIAPAGSPNSFGSMFGNAPSFGGK